MKTNVKHDRHSHPVQRQNEKFQYLLVESANETKIQLNKASRSRTRTHTPSMSAAQNSDATRKSTPPNSSGAAPSAFLPVFKHANTYSTRSSALPSPPFALPWACCCASACPRLLDFST